MLNMKSFYLSKDPDHKHDRRGGGGSDHLRPTTEQDRPATSGSHLLTSKRGSNIGLIVVT